MWVREKVAWIRVKANVWKKERLNSEYILDIQQIRLSDGLTSMQVGSCSGVS